MEAGEGSYERVKRGTSRHDCKNPSWQLLVVVVQGVLITWVSGWATQVSLIRGEP